MAYGLKIRNNSGTLTISDERIVPRFVGKASYVSLTNDSGAGSNRVMLNYTKTGLTPGDKIIYAYTMPENSGVWYGQYFAGELTVNGSGQVDITIHTIFFTSGMTLPEVYLFTLSRPTSVGSGEYGLALRDSSGLLTYTTTSSPLMIASMPSKAVDGSSVALPSTFSKYAFFPPGYLNIIFTIISTSGMGASSEEGWFAGHRISSGTLISNRIQWFYTSHPGNNGGGSWVYGSTSSQPIPIINAASYD